MKNTSNLRVLNEQTTISLLLVLLFLAGTYYYLIPQFKESQTEKYTNQAKLTELQETSQKMEALKSLIDSSRVKAEARGVNFAQFKNVYPATEQMPELVVQLDQIKAQNTGLGMKYDLTKPENDGLISKMTLTVTATGQYPALKDLVDRLQRNVRPVIFTQVSFSTGSDDTVNLNATGYVQSKSVSSTYLSK